MNRRAHPELPEHLEHIEETEPNSFTTSNSTTPPFSMSFTYNDSAMTDIDLVPFLKSASCASSESFGVNQHRNMEQPVFQEGNKHDIPTIEAKIDKVPRQQNGLMSLLSGKQGSKKKARVPAAVVEEQLPVETDTDCDVSDNIDSSFTESKSKQIMRDFDVLELEKKIYKDEIESVSAKDFFNRLKKPSNPPKPPPEIEIVDKDVLIIDDDNSNDTEDLESKIYGEKAKRTSAKDFLSFLQPSVTNSKKTKKPKPSLMITLKVRSEVLQDIKDYENPLKTRGNSTFSGSVAETSNDFFRRPKTTKKSNSNKSFFESMMSASKNNAKLTPLQKLKELEPPVIPKSELHVRSADGLQHTNSFLHTLPKKSKAKLHSSSKTASLKDLCHSQVSPPCHKCTIKSKPISKIDLLNKKIPDYHKYPQLVSIVEKFINNDTASNQGQLWTDLFEPECSDDLIINSQVKIKLRNWIRNSFRRLKFQSLKNPRNVMLKEKKRKLQKSLDNFIVNDFEESEGEETDEEIFMPLFILQGSVGSCKSASVYTIMKEMGGYVHEINSGSNRGRKDIFNSLKEFCTTQLVHKQSESKKFQQGIVLLEDVNILFEQDKSFWSVVQDILNISRRPMIMTCENLLNIPKSILEITEEEDSIVFMDNYEVPQRLVKSYLWICGVSQGYDIKSRLLDKIMSENYNGSNYDLRKCLVECQMICQNNLTVNDEVIDIDEEVTNFNDRPIIEITSNPASKKEELADLESYSGAIELLSESDTLESSYRSAINHDTQENEFSDIYLIDDTARLTQPTLPYELNIGKQLSNAIIDRYQINTKSPHTIHSNNDLKDLICSLVGSRSKKKPKFIQDLVAVSRTTRYQNSSGYNSGTESPSPETTGIPDTSFINYITPKSLVLELLPICRSWVSFQIALENYDSQQQSTAKSSLKEFLNYRDFQHIPKNILGTINQNNSLHG